MHRLKGAGVLPFRVTDDGTVVFLLGREAYASGWHGSGKLSAFEGGSESGDRSSPVDNAVREFVEESLGVLCDQSGDAEALGAQLRRDDFAVRVCTRDTQRREEHHLFVKRFAWSSDVLRLFKERRDALLAIRDRGERMRDLERTLPRVYPLLRHEDTLVWRSETHRVVDVHAHISDGTLRVQMLLESGSAQRVRRFAYAPADERCRQFVNLVELRRGMAHCVASLPGALHAALKLELSPHGFILRAAVRGEWLEKAGVHECTAAQLEAALRGGGHSFRPYFALMAQQVVAQFAAPPPPGTVMERRSSE